MNKLFKLLLFFTCISFFITFFDYPTEANENNQENSVKNEGTLVYQFKYNYNEIYALLGLTEKEYDNYWKKGLSISEMAKKQGVNRQSLEEYFATFHKKEMQKWRNKGILTDNLYFTLVYQLKDEINEFIDRNPNK